MELIESFGSTVTALNKGGDIDDEAENLIIELNPLLTVVFLHQYYIPISFSNFSK